MADTVKINGVTLTREQVENALKELNSPKFQPGDILAFKDGSADRYLVGGVDVDMAFAAAWKYFCKDIKGTRMINTIRLRDGTAYTASIDRFYKVFDGSSL